MIDLNIDELDRKLMITESDFERAVLKYLWNYVVNAPVEIDFIQICKSVPTRLKAK